MAEQQRTYFVIDMKSFFASVECAERGLDPFQTALVVADTERSASTICLAVTPYLKSLGVPNRCRLFQIPPKIDYLAVPPRMKKYIDYAAEIYAIYLRYIDKNDIHVYSIDECFIDATDYLSLYHLSAKEFVQQLMNQIQTELHIPSSAGIGTNMYLAKIALDITAKHSPDRIGYLTEEKFRQELWAHQPLTDFWGISRGTAERLAKHNLYTMQDITRCHQDILYDEFGVNAELLIDHAWGCESCLMADIKTYQPKSHSRSSSQILPSNYSWADAKNVMQEMILSGCYDLAREHAATQLLHLFFTYGDNQEVVKGTVRMRARTNVYSIISDYADQLFAKIVDKRRPIRKIGYDFGELSPDSFEFYDLFTDPVRIQREKKLTGAILEIQNKYGKNALLKGINYKEKATQRERNQMIGGHKSGAE